MNRNFEVRDAVFFIKLQHFEGEFPRGLAQRTFSEADNHDLSIY